MQKSALGSFIHTRANYAAGLAVAAGLALSLAIAVYYLARANPPQILSALIPARGEPIAFAHLLASAPSFLYTLALGIVIGIAAAHRRRALLHCLVWTLLSLLFEITQQAQLAAAISARLANTLPETLWQITGPYWTRGVFDPLDLAATLAGGLVALALLSRLPAETRHADA